MQFERNVFRKVHFAGEKVLRIMGYYMWETVERKVASNKFEYVRRPMGIW